MAQKITAKVWRQATGSDPENDDLERANCPKVGTLGHAQCGWDTDLGLPRYMTFGMSPETREEVRAELAASRSTGEGN